MADPKVDQQIDKAVESFRKDVAEAFGVEQEVFHGTTINDLLEMVENVEGK